MITICKMALWPLLVFFFFFFKIYLWIYTLGFLFQSTITQILLIIQVKLEILSKLAGSSGDLWSGAFEHLPDI